MTSTVLYLASALVSIGTLSFIGGVTLERRRNTAMIAAAYAEFREIQSAGDHDGE